MQYISVPQITPSQAIFFLLAALVLVSLMLSWNATLKQIVHLPASNTCHLFRNRYTALHTVPNGPKLTHFDFKVSLIFHTVVINHVSTLNHVAEFWPTAPRMVGCGVIVHICMEISNILTDIQFSFVDSASPSLCPAGQYSLGSSTSCRACPAGYACANASAGPVACIPGTYSIGNQSTCTGCPAGYACPSTTTAAIMFSCRAGEWDCCLNTGCCGRCVYQLIHKTSSNEGLE